MQKYVNQLIGDLREAKKRPRPPKMSLPPELEFVRGAEEYLHGERYKMSQLFGLEKIQFPPKDKLTDEEMQALVDEIVALWLSFNFQPDFPEGLPLEYQYKILVDELDKETSHTTQGNLHIGFCTYDPDSCPFPGDFCTCKDFEDDEIEDMDSMNFDDDASPF